MDQATDPIIEDEDYSIGLIIGSFIFILAIVLFFVYRKLTQGRASTVLIIGLTDSGKTLMFMRLIDGNYAPTVTSQIENEIEMENHVKLVDIPGAVNVRQPAIAKYLQKASCIKGVLFVLDSHQVSKQSRDIAELLYDVITQLPSSVPLCMACNKHDLPTAKATKIIERQLVSEMELLYQSRVSSLESTDGQTLMAKEFEWPKNTTWVHCFAKNDQGEDKEDFDIDGVETWIQEL